MIVQASVTVQVHFYGPVSKPHNSCEQGTCSSRRSSSGCPIAYKENNWQHPKMSGLRQTSVDPSGGVLERRQCILLLWTVRGVLLLLDQRLQILPAVQWCKALPHKSSLYTDV